jgi:hypothetical protein
MVLWWIANIVGLVVVIPLVIVLANRTIRTALEIRRYADEILHHGVGITATLDPLPALAETSRLTERVTEHAAGYVTALRSS